MLAIKYLNPKKVRSNAFFLGFWIGHIGHFINKDFFNRTSLDNNGVLEWDQHEKKITYKDIYILIFIKVSSCKLHISIN